MAFRIPPLLRSSTFGLLVALFVLEFFLFDHYGARRFTELYPRWHDPAQYLTESYAGYEFSRARSLPAGLLQALTNPSSEGTLHDFFSLITFWLSSPSRSAALSVNILALIAWQAALFFALVRATGSRSLALAAALLPLMLTGPWDNIPGSAYDFRLDHLAMCALGVTAAAAVAADAFYSRRGANWFGVAAGVTVLARFRTGPYLLVALAALAVWVLRRPPERRLRGLNLLRAAVIAAVIAVPTLWLNYDAIAGDYSLARYLGRESVVGNPATSVMDSARLVFQSLGQRHLGAFFGVMAALGALALAVSRRGERVPSNPDLWRVGLIFTFAPAFVLVLDPHKHEVLTSAVVPGAVLLVAALWNLAGERATSRWRAAVAGGVIVPALLFYTHRQVPPAYPPAVEQELRQVTTMAVHLQTRARLAGLREPRVAVDHVSDALDARVLGLVAYERQHLWLPFEGTLPTGTDEPAEAAVMERLARSDFVFLTEDGAASRFPYDRKLAALQPAIRAWCESHLRAVDRFTFAGRRMVLYQRAEIPLR